MYRECKTLQIIRAAVNLPKKKRNLEFVRTIFLPFTSAFRFVFREYSETYAISFLFYQLTEIFLKT